MRPVIAVGDSLVNFHELQVWCSAGCGAGEVAKGLLRQKKASSLLFLFSLGGCGPSTNSQISLSKQRLSALN